MKDIETILNTLIFDGKVDMTLVADASSKSGSAQRKLYRAVSQAVTPTGLVRTPCGVCPVSCLLFTG